MEWVIGNKAEGKITEFIVNEKGSHYPLDFSVPNDITMNISIKEHL